MDSVWDARGVWSAELTDSVSFGSKSSLCRSLTVSMWWLCAVCVTWMSKCCRKVLVFWEFWRGQGFVIDWAQTSCHFRNNKLLPFWKLNIPCTFRDQILSLQEAEICILNFTFSHTAFFVSKGLSTAVTAKRMQLNLFMFEEICSRFRGTRFDFSLL